MSTVPKSYPAYVLITPARNEQPNIGRIIECMIAQTRLPLRWIIVSDGSTDETAAIVRPYCTKVLVDRAYRDAAASRKDLRCQGA